MLCRIEGCKRLQVLFLRANQLNDDDITKICSALEANNCIKVLDISSNTGVTGEGVRRLGDVLNHNRNIEYLGLSKLNLETHDVTPLFNLIGRFAFPEDQVEGHLAELKKRDAIIEKNKKLKASKKPEEPVPQLDNIEQIQKKNAEGEIVTEWVTIKNP